MAAVAAVAAMAVVAAAVAAAVSTRLMARPLPADYNRLKLKL